MELTEIVLEKLLKGKFENNCIDGLRHEKVLTYLSVVQATTGSYSFTLGNEPQQEVGTRGFFIAPAFSKQTIVHHVDPVSRTMSARWIFLDIKANGTQLDHLVAFPGVVDEVHARQLDEVFNAIFASDDICDNMSCGYQLIKILLQMAVLKNVFPLPILDAVNYMKAYLDERISISLLAKTANLSQSRFFSVFKASLGVSPMAYLMNLRLSRASILLDIPALSISEIASKCGISDVYYFSKAFKQKYGVSPSEFRKRSFAGSKQD